MPGTAITFSTNSLQTNNIVTSSIKKKVIKDARSYPIAHANQSVIPFVEHPNSTVVIRGQILGSSVTDCEDNIDTFYSYMLPRDANLDISFNGTTRRWIATATDIDVEQPGGLSYANFTVVFNCTSFAQDVTPTTVVSATGRTSRSYTDAYTFLGTAPFQLPIITVTFTAVTGGTAKTVTVGNNNTGQMISVTRTWVASDVLQVNSVTNEVLVNGITTGVEYSGAFPTFQPGAQSIGYVDTLTTGTFNYSVTYNVLNQ